MRDDDGALWNVVDKRRGGLEKERQVILDASRGDAAADVDIGGTLGWIALEGLPPARPESRPGLLVHGKFMSGQNPDGIGFSHGALSFGVEQPDVVEFVIEKVQAAHPGKPLIFQRTIYRERRNFNTGTAASEANRIAVVDSLMKIACKKYKDVYYIHPNASAPDHETTQDGTHPSDRGYQLWAQSIEKPVKKILRKYGIK